MRKPWRLLALAAAFNVIAGVGVVTAQTAVVRGAPAGSTIELVLNSVPAGKAVPDAAGDAKIPFNLSTLINKPQADLNVAVDVCGDMRRVLLFERGQQPAPPVSPCERRDITGLFLVRRETNLVVSLADPNPSVLLIQGSYSLQPPGPGTLWASPPTGLVLFGGIGWSKFSNALVVACGTVSPCEGDESPMTYTGGATFWISPYLAAEGSYFRPKKLSFTGTGDTFRFTGTFDADIVTIVGKIGLPFRTVRVYGMAGTNYTHAVSGTSETINEKTITVDGVTQTIPGGTQALELKTSGWSWLFGGGAELWVFRSVGVYGEFSRMGLKGSARDNVEGTIDDAATTLMVGVRLRIWK
jgi:hypothetical protein